MKLQKRFALLLAALLDALIVAYAFWKKRRDRFADLFIFIVLMVCFVFSMVAPGNGVRANMIGYQASALKAGVDATAVGVADATAKLDAAIEALKAVGVEVVSVDNSVIASARAAWNVLMCAELCNNY